VLVAVAALSAVLGVAILRANAAFADLGRTVARTVIAPEVAKGISVWYVGQWGFQWYAEEAGARFFPLEPPFPGDGDLVVACLECEPHLEVREMEALVLEREFRYQEPGGRTMNKPSGAGFFSNSWGYLPWAWGDGLVEGFDAFRVRHPR
jgi:hypothetical protein